MKRQIGLALMTVLLVFAIVSVLAIQILNRQSADVERTTNMLLLQQARAYSFGVEAAARSGLYLDWKANRHIDHLQEKWNKPLILPLKPGTASIKIQDVQGRFNLNSMLPSASHYRLQSERFKKLLNLLGLNVEYANLWAKWINKNSQEDDRYQSLEPPYKAAYQGCQHSSELLLLEGFKQKDFRLLEPFVSCLPKNTALNVNTASDYVLASLNNDYTLADGKKIIEARKKQGFNKVDDFWQLPIVQEAVKKGQATQSGKKQKALVNKWEKTDFSVYTEYFEVFAKIQLFNRVATCESLLKRTQKDGKIYSLRRDYSRREGKLEVTEPYTEGQNKNMNIGIKLSFNQTHIEGQN